MAGTECSFHLFPKFPAEIRLQIWRHCLPYRIYELDYPDNMRIFGVGLDEPSPCKLSSTSFLNACPPVITRVCRESRGVAFETGGLSDPFNDAPADACWSSWNDMRRHEVWHDRGRDSTHLNWDESYNGDFQCIGDPLPFLIWHTAQTASQRCSLMYRFFTTKPGKLGYFVRKMIAEDFPDHPSLSVLNMPEEVEALKRLPQCLVVMRVVVVHANFKSAASTGLFGLLGDARVQIIDAEDEGRVNDFLELAKESERRYPVTVGQKLDRIPLESIKQQLAEILWLTYASKDLIQSMRPAYMFRLCTKMCNWVDGKENMRS